MHHARTNGAARSATSTAAMAGLTIALAAGMASAQSQMVTSGTQNLGYIGHQVQDYWIPDIPGATVLLTVRGGDGGDAVFGRNNTQGGEGATVTLLVTIGNGVNQLRPGGRLRFVVGEHGGLKRGNADGGGGGGGGGTGVIYEADATGDDWTVLAVAGGGGGGFRGSGISRVGKNAPLGFNGDPGDNGGGKNGGGGLNGLGGGSGTNTQDSAISGGGGGILGDGVVAGAGVIEPNNGTFPGLKGLPAGGRGGLDQGSGTYGGWGMGGGGSGHDAGAFRSGGGGGGGYSGGGGGAQGRPGGGGGSYGNPAYGAVGAASGNAGEHGSAAYQFTFIPPPPTPPANPTNLYGVSIDPSVNINADGSFVDAVIGVYNTSGDLLATNEDQFGFTSSQIDASLQPGVYYASVTSWPNSALHGFEVETFQATGGPYNINIGGAQQSGFLPTGGVAWYRFEVSQAPSNAIDAGVANASGVFNDTTLQIDRTASNMVLGLYDADGQLLAVNDDDDDFDIESRIVQNLEPGSYYLSVTEFGDTPKPFFTFENSDTVRTSPIEPVKVGSQTVSVPVPANTVGWVRFDVTGARSSDITDLGVLHAPGLTIINSIGTSFINPTLTLLTPEGQVLGNAGINSPLAQPQIVTSLASGSYYAAVAIYPEHVSDNFAFVPGGGASGFGTLFGSISGIGASASFSDPIIAGQARYYRFELETPPPPPACVGDMTTTGATLVGQPGFGVPDGTIDLDDLGYYLNAWIARDTTIADFTTTGATLEGQPGFGTPDGTVDLDDLGFFLNAWLAGCP
ncbi:MAG: GC-type dockerin domain-anchored protein [Planctomycetota bacterium]